MHREADGNYYYEGRIDSQVKLRGYRVELEAIEARLAECDGVREAACQVQKDGGQQMLVAFVVPEDGRTSLSFDELKASLRQVLPTYMVPSRFATLSELPTTVGGKLNRKLLPVIAASERDDHQQVIAPRNVAEEKLAAAFQDIFRLRDGISIHDDFFNDLGGDSLHGAELISLLRDDPATDSITVRDLYEARTVADLALRVRTEEHAKAVIAEASDRAPGHPLLATSLQTLWLLVGLVLGSSTAYLTAFDIAPFLIRSLGLIPFLLLSPLLVFVALAIYTLAAVLLAVLVKWLLIGRYRPRREPVWGKLLRAPLDRAANRADRAVALARRH